MSKNKRERSKPAESGGCSQKWLLSYGDSMTNLMTFFVLLVSFSSFDDKQFRKVSMSLSSALPSLRVSKIRSPKDAIVPTRPTGEEIDRGSERMTLEGQVKGNLEEDTAFKDFQDKKVFLVDSAGVFWGHGTMLTKEGTDLLRDISLLLKAVSNKVVVNEYPITKERSRASGLARAWAVANYISAEEDIPLERFAVSDQGVISTEDLPLRLKEGAHRVLEIVILERSLAR